MSTSVRSRVLGGLAAGLFVCAMAPQAPADILFHETFNGYTYFPNGGSDPTNAGLPQISEGADELWYGARFEYYDGGTVEQDLAIQKIPGGGRPSPDPVGRAEDDAGLLFKVDTTGFENVQLMFDWRMFSGGTGDKLVAGWTTLDLAPFFDSNRIANFFSDPAAGNGSQAGAVAWWNDNWTEIVRGGGSSWHLESGIPLPSDTSHVWVALWVDNGEHDFIKVDNIKVTADLIPEPASLALLGLGGIALLSRRQG